MPRSRVMSFISQFGGPPRSPTSTSSSPAPMQPPVMPRQEASNSAPSLQRLDGVSRDSPPPPRARHERAPSRPMSMLQTYHPPLMEVAQDTLPELQPIFTFLNSHSNKLYQEGYFLKLNDLDPNGRPSADRTWVECFAQLVGTILSLWDAAALDAAGQDGEVVPSFINLTDASIKMIEQFPTRPENGQPLQNVLSISTAGRNRYLLHFNSHHSLIQWTASIRLAMYEHATLQEAYTGSLIAGKGKALPNIKVIMERTKFKSEDWARVRFGAGTPWRRCWCVITPPDEKQVQKQQKQLKKKSAYTSPHSVPALKGDIKLYDTKKTKKAKPIATITNVYSAYSIYPQSKPLIDQSTLVKVEGTITIHSEPATVSEGFVFVMPEVHAAVPGFEMMLRWLFPVFDTFGLYGRPHGLIADIRDTRGLMFAMPQEKRYGYLETLDVVSLILTEGSQKWTEGEWRKNLKELTSRRMVALSAGGSRAGSRAGSRKGARNSLPSRSAITFDDSASVRSNPSLTQKYTSSQQNVSNLYPSQTGSAPPGANSYGLGHRRSVSESQGYDRYRGQDNTYQAEPPAPPPHASGVSPPYQYGQPKDMSSSNLAANERSSSEGEIHPDQSKEFPVREMQPLSSPVPVVAPPAFAHAPGTKPLNPPQPGPELRRANRMSADTLAQISGANAVASAGAAAAWRLNHTGHRNSGEGQGDYRNTPADGQRGVHNEVSGNGISANYGAGYEGMVISSNRSSVDRPLPPIRSSDSYRNSQESPRYNPDASPPVPPHQYSLHNPIRQQTDPSPPTYNRGSYDASGYPRRNSEDQGPPVPEKIPHDEATRQMPPPLRTGTSISRKPVPIRTSTIQSAKVETPVTASDSSSLRRHVFDPSALDQIVPRTELPTRADSLDLQRHPSAASSNYDNDTTASPDYASTRESTDTKRSAVSVEKPRAGVMRTVGTTEPTEEEVRVGDAHYKLSSQQQSESTWMPNIDFGPTYNLASGPGRPGTSGTMTQSEHDRSRSSGSKEFYSAGSGNPSPQAGSPAGADEKNRHSYVHTGKPGSGNQSREHSRPPSRNLTTPEPYRTSSGVDSDGRRSMIWQPGTASPGRPGEKITAEQFVQQRAAAAAQPRGVPVYAHQRNQSSNSLGRLTPELSRNSSAEGPALPRARNSNGENPPRPHSRGAFLPQGPAGGSGDYSTRLSAREQEYVAKVTGSPLINMAGGNSTHQAQSSGLVGAIAAREREKKEIKEGFGGQMVQHAVAQRQQQAQNNSYGRVSPNPQFGGALPAAAIPQQQYAQQQYAQQHYPTGQYQQQQGGNWQSQAARVYAQGGGWSRPLPNPQANPQYPQQQQQFGSHQGSFQQDQGGRG